jgi:O-antigen ligase
MKTSKTNFRKMNFGKMKSSLLIAIVIISILWLAGSYMLYGWYKKRPTGPASAPK